ncbi:MAG: hypothetical protein ACI3VB_09565 [Oscillospiraceae bacterium]
MSKKEKTIKFPKNKPGRRIRGMSSYMAVTPFIMRTRGDASNYFKDSVEISETEKFLRAKRAEGYKGLGMLHLFIAAYIRVVSQKPQLNRYITGQRAYARKNIEVVMTVKEVMAEGAGETSIKVIFDPHDTIYDVYNKMNEAIASVKNKDEGNATTNVADSLTKMPRILFKFAVWFLNLLDYFNALPKALLKASPFHGSMIITDMGSLGIPPIYHHLYNFGNLPIFISFGIKRRAYELNKNGEPEERRYVDYAMVCDERICDGYGYAQGLKLLKNCLMHPEQLEAPPEKVVEDIY